MRMQMSSAVPADIAELLSDAPDDPVAAADEADAAAAAVRMNAAAGKTDWIGELDEDALTDFLMRLFACRGSPPELAKTWALCIDCAAQAAEQRVRSEA